MTNPFDSVAPRSDLIYDHSFVPALKVLFPDLVATDASDFIHEKRVEVAFEASLRDWFRALLRTGASQSSFHFQLHLRMPKNPDRDALFADLIRELDSGLLPPVEVTP